VYLARPANSAVTGRAFCPASYAKKEKPALQASLQAGYYFFGVE